VKDIVLWQSKAAREREERRLRELTSLHQLTIPPRELTGPVPRKLRWKRVLRFTVAFEATMVAFMASATIWLGIRTAAFYREMERDAHQATEMLQRKAEQATDPERKARIEKAIRDGEDTDRRLLPAFGRALALVCVMPLLFFLVYSGLNWFFFIRPNLLLLRRGAPVRGSVIRQKRRLGFVPAVEFAFTTDRGEHIRRTQPVVRSEALLFNVGDSVWVLYLPRRPRTAQIYGLKSALAEVATG
jgi:hypothetical protein